MKPIKEWTSQDILDFLKSVDKKTWIKIGIGVLIAAFLIFFIVWPAWFKRPAVRTQIQTFENQLRTVETLGKKKDAWEKDKKKYSEFIQNSKTRVYMPGETSLLLGAVSKLAKETHVSIISSQPQPYDEKLPPPYDQQYEGSMYIFSVEGNYHELANFIGKVESNPKVLRIKLFEIKPEEKNQKSHTADITLSAVSNKKAVP